MLSRSIYSDSWMYNVGPLSRTIRSNVDYGVSLCHAYSTDNEDSQHSHALIQQFRTCHSNSTIKIIANNPFPFDSPHSSYKKPDYPGYRIVHFRKEKKTFVVTRQGNMENVLRARSFTKLCISQTFFSPVPMLWGVQFARANYGGAHQACSRGESRHLRQQPSWSSAPSSSSCYPFHGPCGFQQPGVYVSIILDLNHSTDPPSSPLTI
jgi:hypothetical protein